MATWQVQQAKSRLSELLEEADVKGPQLIRRHGMDRSVVLSVHDYEQLLSKAPAAAGSDLKEFLLGGPKLDPDDDFFYDVKREHHRRDVEFDD
jgi:prevent-host-death family protein